MERHAPGRQEREEQVMSRRFTTIVAAAFLALSGIAAPANAQEGAVKQVKLDAKKVEMMIATTKALNALEEQAGTGEATDAADAQFEAEVDKAVKAAGFADVSEYDAVANSVMLALSTMSKSAADLAQLAKEEIERVKADTSIPEDAKKKMLETLEEQVRNPPKVEFPENIEVVKPFQGQLEELFSN
jgi:hypothetical protein